MAILNTATGQVEKTDQPNPIDGGFSSLEQVDISGKSLKSMKPTEAEIETAEAAPSQDSYYDYSQVDEEYQGQVFEDQAGQENEIAAGYQGWWSKLGNATMGGILKGSVAAFEPVFAITAWSMEKFGAESAAYVDAIDLMADEYIDKNISNYHEKALAEDAGFTDKLLRFSTAGSIVESAVQFGIIGKGVGTILFKSSRYLGKMGASAIEAQKVKKAAEVVAGKIKDVNQLTAAEQFSNWAAGKAIQGARIGGAGPQPVYIKGFNELTTDRILQGLGTNVLEGQIMAVETEREMERMYDPILYDPYISDAYKAEIRKDIKDAGSTVRYYNTLLAANDIIGLSRLGAVMNKKGLRALGVDKKIKSIGVVSLSEGAEENMQSVLQSSASAEAHTRIQTTYDDGEDVYGDTKQSGFEDGVFKKENSLLWELNPEEAEKVAMYNANTLGAFMMQQAYSDDALVESVSGLFGGGPQFLLVQGPGLLMHRKERKAANKATEARMNEVKDKFMAVELGKMDNHAGAEAVQKMMNETLGTNGESTETSEAMDRWITSSTIIDAIRNNNSVEVGNLLADQAKSIEEDLKKENITQAEYDKYKGRIEFGKEQLSKYRNYMSYHNGPQALGFALKAEAAKETMAALEAVEAKKRKGGRKMKTGARQSSITPPVLKAVSTKTPVGEMTPKQLEGVLGRLNSKLKKVKAIEAEGRSNPTDIERRRKKALKTIRRGADGFFDSDMEETDGKSRFDGRKHKSKEALTDIVNAKYNAELTSAKKGKSNQGKNSVKPRISSKQIQKDLTELQGYTAALGAQSAKEKRAEVIPEATMTAQDRNAKMEANRNIIAEARVALSGQLTDEERLVEATKVIEAENKNKELKYTPVLGAGTVEASDKAPSNPRIEQLRVEIQGLEDAAKMLFTPSYQAEAIRLTDIRDGIEKKKLKYLRGKSLDLINSGISEFKTALDATKDVGIKRKYADSILDLQAEKGKLVANSKASTKTTKTTEASKKQATEYNAHQAKVAAIKAQRQKATSAKQTVNAQKQQPQGSKAATKKQQIAAARAAEAEQKKAKSEANLKPEEKAKKHKAEQEASKAESQKATTMAQQIEQASKATPTKEGTIPAKNQVAGSSETRGTRKRGRRKVKNVIRKMKGNKFNLQTDPDYRTEESLTPEEAKDIKAANKEATRVADTAPQQFNSKFTKEAQQGMEAGRIISAQTEASIAMYAKYNNGEQPQLGALIQIVAGTLGLNTTDVDAVVKMMYAFINNEAFTSSSSNRSTLVIDTDKSADFNNPDTAEHTPLGDALTTASYNMSDLAIHWINEDLMRDHLLVDAGTSIAYEVVPLAELEASDHNNIYVHPDEPPMTWSGFAQAREEARAKGSANTELNMLLRTETFDDVNIRPIRITKQTDIAATSGAVLGSVRTVQWAGSREKASLEDQLELEQNLKGLRAFIYSKIAEGEHLQGVIVSREARAIDPHNTAGTAVVKNKVKEEEGGKTQPAYIPANHLRHDENLFYAVVDKDNTIQPDILQELESRGYTVVVPTHIKKGATVVLLPMDNSNVLEATWMRNNRISDTIFDKLKQTIQGLDGVNGQSTTANPVLIKRMFDSAVNVTTDTTKNPGTVRFQVTTTLNKSEDEGTITIRTRLGHTSYEATFAGFSTTDSNGDKVWLYGVDETQGGVTKESGIDKITLDNQGGSAINEWMKTHFTNVRYDKSSSMPFVHMNATSLYHAQFSSDQAKTSAFIQSDESGKLVYKPVDYVKQWLLNNTTTNIKPGMVLSDGKTRSYVTNTITLASPIGYKGATVEVANEALSTTEQAAEVAEQIRVLQEQLNGLNVLSAINTLMTREEKPRSFLQALNQVLKGDNEGKQDIKDSIGWNKEMTSEEFAEMTEGLDEIITIQTEELRQLTAGNKKRKKRSAKFGGLDLNKLRMKKATKPDPIDTTSENEDVNIEPESTVTEGVSTENLENREAEEEAFTEPYMSEEAKLFKGLLESLGLGHLFNKEVIYDIATEKIKSEAAEGFAQGVHTTYSEGVLKGLARILIGPDGTFEVLVHESLHNFLANKQSTEKSEAFAKSIFNVLNSISEEGTWFSRATEAYANKEYNKSAEELAILYLTSKEFRDNLPTAIVKRIEKWLLANDYVTGEELAVYLGLDLTRKIADFKPTKAVVEKSTDVLDNIVVPEYKKPTKVYPKGTIMYEGNSFDENNAANLMTAVGNTSALAQVISHMTSNGHILVLDNERKPCK